MCVQGQGSGQKEEQGNSRDEGVSLSTNRAARLDFGEQVGGGVDRQGTSVQVMAGRVGTSMMY